RASQGMFSHDAPPSFAGRSEVRAGAKSARHVVRRIAPPSNTSSAGKKHVTSANDKMAPRASKSPKLATADSVDENANANPAVAKMPADTMSEGKVPPKARNTACRGGSSLRWRR